VCLIGDIYYSVPFLTYRKESKSKKEKDILSTFSFNEEGKGNVVLCCEVEILDSYHGNN